MSQLLVEYIPFKISKSLVAESISQNGGKLIVSGVLQRANAKNQNGRIYPRPILEREVKRYLGNEVAQKRALGELDHPDSSTINLKNVSHNILEMKWNGDDLVGTVEVLSTPAGNILKSLFEAGITVGISSRGMGSVKAINEGDDTMEVQEDFSLVGFDFVSTPSTHGAYMTPIQVREGVESRAALTESYSITKEGKVNLLIHDIICELSGNCCIQ